MKNRQQRLQQIQDYERTLREGMCSFEVLVCAAAHCDDSLVFAETTMVLDNVEAFAELAASFRPLVDPAGLVARECEEPT